jgi:hypothetical protein
MVKHNKDFSEGLKNLKSEIEFLEKSVENVDPREFSRELQAHKEYTDKGFWILLSTLALITSSIFAGFLYLNQRIDTNYISLNQRFDAIEDRFFQRYDSLIKENKIRDDIFLEFKKIRSD